LLLLQQLNLKDFLLQQSDIPLNAQYSSIVNSVESITNKEFDSAYVEETGRVDGRTVVYGKGCRIIGGWTEGISDTVVLYQSAAGVQLAVTMNSRKGNTEEKYHSKIGDLTYTFYYLYPNNTQIQYTIVFFLTEIVCMK
jgi:hypothetical protein